jgi:uroporphyrinogen-III synthase
MAATSHTLTILVPESRELALFAGLLEAEGARVLRCPLVRILDLEETGPAQAWIAQFLQQPFDDLVLLTGEGLRKLLALSGAQREAFIGALAKTRTIVRGPKPARALREIGLAPALAPKPPTSQGILDALAPQDLRGRRIGVQLYPGPGMLADALRERGARVFAVTPYRYASQADDSRVADSIRALAKGDMDVIAFTASPQVERLFAVAREAGLEKELSSGLARTRIAAIGPVVASTLKAHGLAVQIAPESSFHLRPLVRAIMAAPRAS